MNPIRRLLVRTRAAVTAPLRRRALTQACLRRAAPMSVLFYHRIADCHPNDWTLSRDAFRRHVEYAVEHLEPIGLDELQRRVRNGDSPRPTVTFTFDDGYAENGDFALPLVMEHRLPTVYFVATAHVLGGKPFPHDVAAGQPLPVNSASDLRQIADAGIEIGLHTRNHIDFSRCHEPETVRREIVDAKTELEDTLGLPVRYFAVPYGLPPHLHQTVMQTSWSAGLRGVCSAFGAYNVPGRDWWHIRRIHGDPEFARLKNWLSFDPRKVRCEPAVQYHLPRAPEHPVGGPLAASPAEWPGAEPQPELQGNAG